MQFYVLEFEGLHVGKRIYCGDSGLKKPMIFYTKY